MSKNQTVKVELTYGDVRLIKNAVRLASFMESMRAHDAMISGDKPEYHKHRFNCDEFIMFESDIVDEWMLKFNESGD